MNAREVETEVAARLGWSRVRVHRVLSVATHILTHDLAAGHEVTLENVGTFITHDRGPRPWFSALIRKLLLLPAKKVIGFHASRNLLKKLHEAP